MTITELPIELDLEEIAAFCKQWHIAKLEIFGSVLRSDFRSDSDLDFLYTPGTGFQRDLASRRGRITRWPRNYQSCSATK